MKETMKGSTKTVKIQSTAKGLSAQAGTIPVIRFLNRHQMYGRNGGKTDAAYGFAAVGAGLGRRKRYSAAPFLKTGRHSRSIVASSLSNPASNSGLSTSTIDTPSRSALRISSFMGMQSRSSNSGSASLTNASSSVGRVFPEKRMGDRWRSCPDNLPVWRGAFNKLD